MTKNNNSFDLDAELMAMFNRRTTGFASPDKQNLQVPNLIKYLRGLAAPAPPQVRPQPPQPVIPPVKNAQPFPDVSDQFQPKRATRGMVYPGTKPTPSKLYPFLRIK